MKWPGPVSGRTTGARTPPNRTAPSGTPGAPGTPRMPPRRTWLWFAFILLVNFLIARFLFPNPEAPLTVPYTLFKEEAGKGNVQAIYSRGDTLTGVFKTAVTYPANGDESATPGRPRSRSDRALHPGPPRTSTNFTSVLPAFVGPNLEQFLIEHGVEISAEPIGEGGSPWATLLFGFGPAILLIAFYVWLFRRAAQQGGGIGGGIFSIGKSRARRYDQEQDKKVTFNDVAGIDEAENGVAAFVIGDALAILAAQQNRPLRPQHDLLERVEEILARDLLLIAPRGEQRRFVDDVLEIGTGKPGGRARDLLEHDVDGKRHVARVHLQDRGTAGLIRQVHDDTSIETAGPQQRLVEHVGLIRCREHDDAAAAREAVHLGEDLVQRLLLLVRAADRELAARAADRVELVDEDDGGRVLSRLLEQVAHARGANADDHLHELRRAHREERHAGLAGDGFREQRLARTRRADQQHAFRDASAQHLIFFGRL
jgi:hypothetical protein